LNFNAAHSTKAPTIRNTFQCTTKQFNSWRTAKWRINSLDATYIFVHQN
jgi:hypothetical protein